MKKYLTLCFMVLCVIILKNIHEYKVFDHCYIHFLDVGQGDSVVIRHRGMTFIYDGGGHFKSNSSLVNWLEKNDIDQVEGLIVSHAHTDHFEGFVDVIEKYKVSFVLLGPQDGVSKTFLSFLDLLKQKNVTPYLAYRGLTLKSGQIGFKVLYPPKNTTFRGSNDNSLVLKMSFGDKTLLLTGDIEKKAERWLLENQSDKNELKCDLFKVPHHGSKTSSSLEFMKAVKPKVSVISCGSDNSYGFPHEEALLRNMSWSDYVYRIDQFGGLEVVFHLEK